MTWVLEKKGKLPASFQGRDMSVSVGPAGEARFLLRGPGDDPECRLVDGDSGTELGRLGPLFGTFDVFADGRIIVAGFPANREDNTEKNAAILNADGTGNVRFHIGYGYEDIQIGPDNRIWVTYFDEGVFSGGKLPSNGLNAFDDQGNVVWQNDQVHRIDDCYALNVSNAGVWYCAYSDFDLCQVMEDGRISARSNKVFGAHAFAIHDNRVLFAHQYNESPDTVHLATLSSGSIGKPKATRLATEDGVEIMQHAVRMRGGFVHAFAGDAWYRGHLSEL